MHLQECDGGEHRDCGEGGCDVFHAGGRATYDEAKGATHQEAVDYLMTINGLASRLLESGRRFWRLETISCGQQGV